jgi:hypothetical protein
MDVQAAAQLPDSFSHAPDSYPGGARRGHLKLLFWRYASASILYFYANVTVGGRNANPGCRAFRMTMNIVLVQNFDSLRANHFQVLSFET